MRTVSAGPSSADKICSHPSYPLSCLPFSSRNETGVVRTVSNPPPARIIASKHSGAVGVTTLKSNRALCHLRCINQEYFSFLLRKCLKLYFVSSLSAVRTVPAEPSADNIIFSHCSAQLFAVLGTPERNWYRVTLYFDQSCELRFLFHF